MHLLVCITEPFLPERNTSYKLLSLFLLLVLFSGLGHCITSGLSDYTYAENATEIADHEASRLTYVKIGVAIGMFAITAGACSLPVIVITCITRRICSHHSGSRSSALNPPSYTSGTEEGDASSPTFLLDPQSTESDDVLIAQGPDSHRSHNHVDDGRISLYEVDSHDSSSVSHETSHRLNLTNSGASGADVTEMLNGRVEINRNGMIPPSAVPIKTTRRRSSQRRKRLLKTWASRINCFAAGIFLTTVIGDPDRLQPYQSPNTPSLSTSPYGDLKANLYPQNQPLQFYINLRHTTALLVIARWFSILFRFQTRLMDLFPDVNDAIEIALSALKINTHYPLSALFTLLGFFMVLTIEQGAHVCQKKHRNGSASNAEAPHSHQEHSGGHSHNNEMIPEAGGDGSSFQIMLLLISLSIHSVFEGLAVGLQRSVSEVVTLFSALLLHKLIMATSIGFSLAASHQQQERGVARSQWMGALFFSLASPIGVLIGWALITQRSSPALLMAIAVLQGLACGTFFFVVFCEMLPHEFGENEEVDIKDRFGKIAFLVLGFALIALYIAFGPE
ncbi:hypothetical protein ACTXT7_007889 [Hymenolepis weldensis]